jgi:hypothetical protein
MSAPPYRTLAERDELETELPAIVEVRTGDRRGRRR